MAMSRGDMEEERRGARANNYIPTVEFRLVVFRPFKNEVLIGRISSATDQGIRSMSSP